MYKANFS